MFIASAKLTGIPCTPEIRNAAAKIDLDLRFACGDFSIPVDWMAEHVYKYGAIYDTPQLMKIATGNETQAYDFLRYLDSKYERIYNI